MAPEYQAAPASEPEWLKQLRQNAKWDAHIRGPNWLAKNALARLEALERQLAQERDEHAEWTKAHQKEVDDAHRALAQEREARERFERAADFANTLNGTLQERLREVEAALRPFAHEDLRAILGGNVEGDNSPVFGRGKALLTIADFKRAADALKGAPR